MRFTSFVVATLLVAIPMLSQPSCDGGPFACGNTIQGMIAEGSCPTGCLEFSKTHAFNVFGNTTRTTLTAASDDFTPAIEITTPDGTVVDRKEGRDGEPTRLAVVLQPGVHFARVISQPAGASGTYTLRLHCLIADPQVFCSPDKTTLCLYDRFSVRVTLRANDSSPSVAGVATRAGDQFGLFTAPLLTNDPDNPEVLVKILDGRAINGKWWVFLGGLTGFDYEATVRDTFTRREKTYTKTQVLESGGIDLDTFEER
jgi:hypothetical protein